MARRGWFREFDPQWHPRWPRGAPEGRGGEFRRRGDATSWAGALSERIAGTPLWRDRSQIEWLAGQTPTFRSRLSGGAIAKTQRLTYGDPPQHLVRKLFETGRGEHRANAEVMASKVADAVGAPAAIAIPDPEDRRAVYMGFVPGELGFIHNPDPYGGALYYLAQTDAGLRIGLLDVLIRNEDRHNENWILSSELPAPSVLPYPGHHELRTPVAIDHSETFQTGLVKQGARDMAAWNRGERYPIPMDDASYIGFAGAWVQRGPYFGGSQFVRDGAIDPSEGGAFYRPNNPLHPDDIPVLRARLEQLRWQFHAREMQTEYEQMMARFEAVAAHAGGTRRLFP